MILASSTSDLSGVAVVSSATREHVSGLPDPIDGRSQYVVNEVKILHNKNIFHSLSIAVEQLPQKIEEKS